MDSWFFPAMMFAIFVVPVVLLFGYALFDVIRRPKMGIAARALWLIGFCVLPIVGPLVYLVINPPGSREMEERLAGDEATRTAELTSRAPQQVQDQSMVDAALTPSTIQQQRGGQIR